MKKILAFGASSSKNSINKKLASWTASQINDVDITILDLNDFEMTTYSVDKEQTNGIPQAAKDYDIHIKAADGIIISFAEHNGSYTSAFKNIHDWWSRIDRERFNHKPLFIMGASPGARGAQTVMSAVKVYFPFMNAKIVAEFSLPGFNDNFSVEEGIKDAKLKTTFTEELAKFVSSL